MSEKLYYIQSQYAPCGNCISWWAVDAKGYTCDLKEAWKVDEQKAKSICSDKSRREKYWPCDLIDSLSAAHMDFQKLSE